MPVAVTRKRLVPGTRADRLPSARLDQASVHDVLPGVAQLGDEVGAGRVEHGVIIPHGGPGPDTTDGAVPGRGRLRRSCRSGSRHAGRQAWAGSCSASPEMTWWPPLWLTEILRGLASSATGMVSVSTPSE